MDRRSQAAARVASCLLLLAAVGGAQETPPDAAAQPGFEIERVSWVGRVGERAGVTVVNRFGDLRARFGGYEGRVEVFANVQHFASEGPRLVVEARGSESGVEVTVGYRAAEGGELVAAREPGRRKRADLVVYVPRGATLDATTDAGLAEVKGLESDVRVRTAGGEISARDVDGELDLGTGSGDVLVTLERWDTARRHSLVSASGDLSLYLGGEANADVRVATSGLLSTDFSLAVDSQEDRRPIKRATAILGKGSSTITASSLDGHVRLIRRPLAREALVRPDGGGEPRTPPRSAVAAPPGEEAVEVEIGRQAAPIAVETVSGDITAWVDPEADVTVLLATSGEITTDYTIAIDTRYHEEPAKVGRVAIGNGTAVARLTSRRGAVRVLRAIGRPPAPQADPR